MPQDDQIDGLIALYTRQNYAEMVARAERLTVEFPSSFMIWNLLAAGQKALGRLPEAETGFRQAIALNPTYAEGFYNLGITLHDQGKFDAAVLAYQTVCALNPHHATASFNMGNTLREMGELEKAISAYGRAIAINPAYAEAHNNLGNTLRQHGDFSAALAAYARAIQSAPTFAEAYRNYAVALVDEGRIDEAISSYVRAIQINRSDADSYKSVGHLLCERDRLGDAIVAYSRALALTPADFETSIALGNVFRQKGETVQAISAYRNAITLNPDAAEAYNNLGVSLVDIGNLNEAIEAYKTADRLNPDLAQTQNNLGNALNKQGKFTEAISAYERAIQRNPDYAEAIINMGTALHSCGRFDEEISAYQRALAINPDNASGYNNLAGAMLEMGKHDQAIAAYRRCLEINPDFSGAEAQMLHQQQHVCDFSGAALLEDASARLGIQTQATPPFLSLAWADHPEQQLLRATKWAQVHAAHASILRPIKPGTTSERLRVGFFSADIRPHPMMYCLSGILRTYDRASLEVFVYNLYRGAGGEWPEKVAAQVDRFVRAENLSDQELIDVALSHDLDILIDLTGYTAGNRCTVIQARLAPVQINFLGFPGTMGAEFIDYIIADQVVIPEHQRRFYAEKVIYLPHSYFPIDYSRVKIDLQSKRADHGLPEYGFVFCCFNNNYKIGPREFAIWMRLLGNVEGSVLWLLKSNAWARENLRAQAALAGVDPDRLIFADKVSIDAHLERHGHADLFVDTFNYNAHTTACDALWTGVPLVTKIGKQFSARVAASLLTASGVPELITSTEADYEAMALHLAQDADARLRLKAKLWQNRRTCPLFDARGYTRAFESGLRGAFELMQAGKRDDIWVVDPDAPYQADVAQGH